MMNLQSKRKVLIPFTSPGVHKGLIAIEPFIPFAYTYKLGYHWGLLWKNPVSLIM